MNIIIFLKKHGNNVKMGYYDDPAVCTVQLDIGTLGMITI